MIRNLARVAKLRQRWGIAAPRVAIRSQIPWYWRWVGIAALFGVCAAAFAWVYDAGGRNAGYDNSQVQQELAIAKEELAAARAELDQLRAVANAADNRMSIEKSAQQKLAQQIRTLEQENARVREELATLEGMLSADSRANAALTIYRFKVEPDVLPGEYRYHLLLLTPTTRRERDFQGKLELIVSLSDGGQSAMMSFPEPADAGASEFKLAFKYFKRVQGTFRVNPKARVESVQVRVYENGATQPRATHNATL